MLFSCNINDLPKYAGDVNTYLYADDTALLAKGKSIENIQEELQRNVDTILKWFAVNKLALNADKTKVMLFSSNHSALLNQHLCITSGGTDIEQVNHMKYLGVYLDSTLSFDLHIDKICK